jgi:hypothetical protein
MQAAIASFSFKGTISSCFEPHLGPYVELEEKTLMESLEKLVQVFRYQDIPRYFCPVGSMFWFTCFYLDELLHCVWP